VSRGVEAGGHSDHRLLNFLPEVGLSSFFHLGEHHRQGNLFGEKSTVLGLTLERYLNVGLATVLRDVLESKVPQISLEMEVVHLATMKAHGTEHSVLGVHDLLVLGSITKEALNLYDLI